MLFEEVEIKFYGERELKDYSDGRINFKIKYENKEYSVSESLMINHKELGKRIRRFMRRNDANHQRGDSRSTYWINDLTSKQGKDVLDIIKTYADIDMLEPMDLETFTNIYETFEK